MRFIMAAMLMLTGVSSVGAHERHELLDWLRDRDLPTTLGPADAADASADVPSVRYGSVTGATRSFRPVNPMPWGQLNRDVTPRPKPKSR